MTTRCRTTPRSTEMTAEPTATADETAVSESLFRRLAEVWGDLEERLDAVPILRRLAHGTVTLHDYSRLLFNLRQQVVDGSPWISRAASNFDVDHFVLRSAAIR